MKQLIRQSRVQELAVMTKDANDAGTQRGGTLLVNAKSHESLKAFLASFANRTGVRRIIVCAKVSAYATPVNGIR